MNIKKISLFFVVFALSISLLSFSSTAFAETPASDFDYEIDYDNGTVTITYYSGDDIEVVVPTYIEEYPVTIIGFDAFWGNESLMHVTLPNTIKEIQNSAFGYCKNLMSIYLPSGLTTIGSYAFNNTTLLQSITLPSTLTKLDYGAFEWSGITEITIPKSISVINDGVFSNCANLTKVTLPDNLARIGNFAFQDCTSLQAISIPDSVAVIGESAFSTTALTSIILPSNIKSFSNGLFFNCEQLKEIDVPEGVTSIGDNAFASCISLSKITIPSTVKTIGSSAFYNCDSLVEINIPEGTTIIKELAFWECDMLSKVYLPKSITSIGVEAFKQTDYLVLYVWENSYAKTYAMQNGLHYELLDAAQDKNIIEVYSLPDISVSYNTPFSNIYNLPKDVTVKLEDNTTLKLNVTWLSSNYNPLVSGNYYLEGILTLTKGVINTDNKTARIKITVQPGPPVNYHIWSDVKYINTANYTWKIEFNKSLNPNTINKSNVYIKDALDNVYTFINPTVNSNIISVNNNGQFEKDKLYYLYIEQGIKSLDGKTIQQPIKMPFMYK